MSTNKASPDSLRIIFAGTPDFAASSLQTLLNNSFNVVAVYTQPDRPAGRGRKLHASPVKQLAEQYQLPVFQPESLKNDAEQKQLEALKPDLMIVAAYGLILPPLVLAIPKQGCINVHASLLPRWRGAAPIQAAILAGDEQTGITIMQMDAGLDTGDMLRKDICNIGPNETGSMLHDRLASLGAESLLHVLSDLQIYQNKAEQQDNNLATYAHKIEKSHAAIDWQDSAKNILRKVLAFNSWPVAYSEINKLRIRVWEASAQKKPTNEKPGTIISCTNESIDVACGSGVLELKCIQLPGAKALPVHSVLNAKRELFNPGTIFETL